MATNNYGITQDFNIYCNAIGTKPINQYQGFISFDLGSPAGSHKVVLGQNGQNGYSTDQKANLYDQAYVEFTDGSELHPAFTTLYNSTNHGNGTIFTIINNPTHFDNEFSVIRTYRLLIVKSPALTTGRYYIEGDTNVKIFRFNLSLFLTGEEIL